jgi:hypothetical protein
MKNTWNSNTTRGEERRGERERALARRENWHPEEAEK